MNASHARPLAAFCVLTAVAAVITGVGLRADQGPGAGPPTASRAQASRSAAPDLVLGGVLRERSDLALRRPLSPELWAPDVTAAETPSGGSVQVAGPTRLPTTHKARAKSGGAHHTTATQTKGPAPSHGTATPTSTAGPAKGGGHGKPDHAVKPTTPVTPTATPTNPGKGVGDGVGKGKPDDPGH